MNEPDPLDVALWERLREAVYPESGASGWTHASAYLRRYAAKHAAAAGALDELLSDPEYLVQADAARLAAELPTVDPAPRNPGAADLRPVFHASYASHRSCDPDSRRDILMADAARLGQDETVQRLAKSSAWSIRWAAGMEHSPGLRQVLLPPPTQDSAGAGPRHPDADPSPPTGQPVVALAGADLDGTPLIVAAHGSPDRPGPVLIWDLRTGWLRGQLADPGTQAAATSVATYPDGDRVLVAVGHEDGRITVWDLAERTLLHRIEPDGDARVGVRSLTVAEADGEPVLVSAHADDPQPSCRLRRALRRWGLRDGTPLGGLPDGDGYVPVIRALGSLLSGGEQLYAAADAADTDAREVVVGGGDDGGLYTWNVRTGRLVVRSRPGPASIRAVAVAETWDGQPLVVTGHEGGQIPARAGARAGRPSGGYVRGWNPLTGVEAQGITTFRLPRDSVTAVVRHGDRALVLVGGQDGQVHVYDLSGHEPEYVLATHGEGLTFVLTARIGDHDYAITGGAEGSVRVIDVDRRLSTSSRRRSDTSPVRALAVGRTDDGWRVTSMGDDGYLADRSLLTGDENRMERLQKHVTDPRRLAVGLTPAGRPVVVSAERDRVVVLGHPDDGPGRVLPLPPGVDPADVEAVAVRPATEHRSLVAVSVAGRGELPGRVELYQVEDGGVRRLGTATRPTVAATAALTFAVGSALALLTAVDAQGRAIVWDLTVADRPAVVATAETGVRGPTAAGTAVVGDEVVLAVGTRERTVELWNVRAGERRTRRPFACAAPVAAVAVDPHGGLVVSQGRDVLAVDSTEDRRRQPGQDMP